MESPATILSRRLADNAEAVCRHYLSKGRREGRYWLVGDARNTPGRSLYVRLAASGDGRGEAGKWTDAQDGSHGDLLDIIALTCGHSRLRETLEEARQFLSLPSPPAGPDNPRPRAPKAASGTPQAAHRLWKASKPTPGTLAQRYLAGRGLTVPIGADALRFHPRCYYRASEDDAPDVPGAWPAMIAAVTDLGGTVTGVHRTWLTPDGSDKAPVAWPRRAMGELLGHGVRFGRADAVMAAGEGIESVASLRQIMPEMPMIAGLSAAHLAAIVFPAALRRLYVAHDDDAAGRGALATLTERGLAAGIEVAPLSPLLGDANDDLRIAGVERMRESIAGQLGAADRERFLGGGP
jgi:hypothetical protein